MGVHRNEGRSDWKAALGPCVRKQPLLRFVVMMAFAPPLLDVVGPVVGNHGIELVGEPSKSKTTALMLAGSVWGGRPDSAAGFGEDWGTTANGIETYMAAHSDHWLGLNETKLAGSDAAMAKLVSQAVFQIEGGQGKNRFGEGRTVEGARLLYLSTSNKSLRDLLTTGGETARAAGLRLLTLALGPERPHGMFTTVPRGFDHAGGAADEVKATTGRFYGTAGPKFIRALVKARSKDEVRLAARIHGYMVEFEALASQTPGQVIDHRTVKFLALIYAAGRLARKWKCLPRSWGSCSGAMREALDALDLWTAEGALSPAETAARRIEQYAAERAEHLLDLAELPRGLSRTRFEASPGVWMTDTSGKDMLVISSKVFQGAFPDYRQLVGVLRVSGRALTEVGKHPKLTRKVSKAICRNSGVRGYHLFIPRR